MPEFAERGVLHCLPGFCHDTLGASVINDLLHTAKSLEETGPVFLGEKVDYCCLTMIMGPFANDGIR